MNSSETGISSKSGSYARSYSFFQFRDYYIGRNSAGLGKSKILSVIITVPLKQRRGSWLPARLEHIGNQHTVAAVSHCSQNESAQRHDSICIHNTDNGEMCQVSYIPLKVHLVLASVPDADDCGHIRPSYISQVKLKILKSHIAHGKANIFKLRANVSLKLSFSQVSRMRIEKKNKDPQNRAPPKQEICQLADMYPTCFSHIYYVAYNGSYLQVPDIHCSIWHKNNHFQSIPFNWNLNLVPACII